MGALSYEDLGVGSAYLAERPEIIEIICERLAKGEPLAAISREPGMPAPSTVRLWERSSPEIAKLVAFAREDGEEALALEAQEIIDGLRPVEGVPSDPSRDRARADVRLKLLAKFNPKRWGDSTQLRHADANGEKLDTAPLISELMTMLGPSGGTIQAGLSLQPNAPAQAAIDVTPRKPVYRPQPRARLTRAGDKDDVSDLV